MNTIKLKKIHKGRRRFIAGSPMKDFSQWMDEAHFLRQKILTDSAFQIIGHKSIIEVSTKDHSTRVLMEVVGIPRSNLMTFDLEAQEALVFESTEGVFGVDFLTLDRLAREILGGVTHRLPETYHIVVEGQKLELHFFI